MEHAKEKDVILITMDVDDISFDLRHLRTVIYKDDYRGQLNLREELKKKNKHFCRQSIFRGLLKTAV